MAHNIAICHYIANICAGCRPIELMHIYRHMVYIILNYYSLDFAMALSLLDALSAD